MVVLLQPVQLGHGARHAGLRAGHVRLVGQQHIDAALEAPVDARREILVPRPVPDGLGQICHVLIAHVGFVVSCDDRYRSYPQNLGITV